MPYRTVFALYENWCGIFYLIKSKVTYISIHKIYYLCHKLATRAMANYLY